MTKYTLFDQTIPATIDGNDGDQVVLGTTFLSDVNGWITKLRFYKASANTGTHIGYLWDADTGELLSSVTFSEETSSGWQEQSLDSPIPITLGVKYTVSYFAPNGHYSINGNFFGSGYDNAPLHAVSNAQQPNGTFFYPAGGSSAVMPTSGFNAGNYWVDIVFEDTLTPVITVKNRESGAWVSKVAIAKMFRSGTWVVAEVKRRFGSSWIDPI